MKWIGGLLLLLTILPLRAHEVQVTTASTAATVVQLRYADGQPFAFEAYELFLSGQEVPQQVGRTDARGRLFFVAEGHGQWRIKAWSADGHGIDRGIEVDAAEVAIPVTEAPPALPRVVWLALGLSGILGGFGVLQLWVRRRSA